MALALALALGKEWTGGIVVSVIGMLLVLVLVLQLWWVGYIVWIAVYRGSSGRRGYRISLVVGIVVCGKGIVKVRLGGRGGIAVAVAVAVVVVVEVDVKDGRGRGGCGCKLLPVPVTRRSVTSALGSSHLRTACGYVLGWPLACMHDLPIHVCTCCLELAHLCHHNKSADSMANGRPKSVRVGSMYESWNPTFALSRSSPLQKRPLQSTDTCHTP